MIPFIVAVAVLLLLLVGVLWWMQEKVAYQPQSPPFPDPGPVRRVEYRATDGQPLFGYIVGDERSAPGIVLVFHGNADLAAWQIPWAEAVVSSTGYAVFLAEYRGYMGLRGRPTYRGLRLDARAAHQFITDSLSVDPGRIALFGHSLGSAVAAELAAEQPALALLLQSPFTSSHDLARRMVTWPVASVLRPISRVPYDTRALVGRIDAPVSVIHGERDEFIPPQMAREVFAAARSKGELVIDADAGHNDLGTLQNDRYWTWLRKALVSATDRGTSQPAL